ncbi:MAG: DUF475 domain-containing protein [bacterium]
MPIVSMILAVLGLSLFEIINSVDNAIINAEVLHTMKPKARKWFLTWGIVIAVFVVRGLLPLLIVWATNPSLGPWGAFTATFSNDPHIKESIEAAAPILLMGGGTFLVFLFFHWLFLEDKNYGLKGEKFFHSQGIWFYAVASILLAGLAGFAMTRSGTLEFAAVLGSTVFFITHGFKQQAEAAEKKLLNTGMSDWSKIMYLEAIDASFSIDSVLGSFAFTLSVPLILIGNGIGAIVLRQLTVSNIEKVKQYPYLKNGAMYSILVLGTIMILDAFGFHIPEWLSPIATFGIIGFFFWKSINAKTSNEKTT